MVKQGEQPCGEDSKVIITKLQIVCEDRWYLIYLFT